MTTSRLAATGVALALLLTLGACASKSNDDAPSNASHIEGTVPLTVQDRATWKSQIMDGAPVQVTSLGVLTFSADKSVDGKRYAPVLLHPKDGSARWVGEAIESGSMPTLEWVQEGERRWAVAKTVEGNKVSLHAWNGLASRSESKVTSSKVFEGKKNPPNVVFSGTGVLVTGADKTAAEPLVFWPKDASITRYKGGPKRGGEAGAPIGVYGGGFLVSFKGGGFSFASPTGGWSSTSVVPEGANPQTGAVLKQGNGYIISEWERSSGQKDGATILAVHSATSGHLFAQYDVPEDEADILATQKESGAALVTDGSQWLAWGQFSFNFDTGEGSLCDLKQGVPTAIIDGLLYVRDARSLIGQDETTASASPQPSVGGSAEPSDGGSGESTIDPGAPQGFAGVAGLDLATGQPLSGLPSMYPIGRTSTGQVILRDDAKRTIYSVGIR